MKSIINEKNRVKSNWFEKKKIGDSIEGTYIAKRVVFNRLNNQEQNVYELLLPGNEYWNVGGGNPNSKFPAGVDVQMRNVKIGQVVGFKYVEDRKTASGFDAKIVQVFADPKIVNEEWLKQQEEEDIIKTEEVDFNAPAEAVKETEDKAEETLKKINNLAVTKLEANTPEEIKTKVMETTGLAFLPANLDKILEQLEQLPDKK